MGGVRTGVLFGGADLTVDEMASVGGDAETRGVDGLYCVEAYRSGLVPLAALARATRRTTVGPYVLNASFRAPFAAALEALDLSEILPGRLELAVGSGNPHITRHWLGVDPAPPLAQMYDYLKIVRMMLHARPGERVSYRGPVHSIEWVRHVPAGVGRPIPVYLAAVSPKMLQLAAGASDGLALGALTSPAYIRDVIRPLVRAAAERADRDPAGLRVKMCAMVAVHEDRDVAGDHARRAVAGMFAAHSHPYYERLLKQQGFAPQLDKCLTELAAGRTEAAAHAFADVIDSVMIWGTPADCAARLSAYEGVVDEVVLANTAAPLVPGDDDAVARYRLLLEVIERARRAGRPSAGPASEPGRPMRGPGPR